MDDILAFGVIGAFLVVVALAGISLLLARRKDLQLGERAPATLPYRWGYFLGYSGLITAVLVAIGGAMLTVFDVYAHFTPVLIVYAVLFGIASYGVLRRRRWGWLAHIPLSLNPGLWAFNSIYFSNRWREFA